MGVVEIIGLLLGVVDKILDKLPSYEQAKKNKYYKLKRDYEDELSKDFPHRDDERVVLLRMELLDFIRTFQAEIQ